MVIIERSLRFTHTLLAALYINGIFVWIFYDIPNFIGFNSRVLLVYYLRTTSSRIEQCQVFCATMVGRSLLEGLLLFEKK